MTPPSDSEEDQIRECLRCKGNLTKGKRMHYCSDTAYEELKNAIP